MVRSRRGDRLAWTLFLLSFGVLIPRAAVGQRALHVFDVGGGLGVTSYTGDYNMSALPRTVQGHGLFLFRYAFHELYSVRANILGGAATGRYDKSRYYLPHDPPDAELMDYTRFFAGGDLQIEIHFRPFECGLFTHTRVNHKYWTPFVSLGVGAQWFQAAGFVFYLPLGGGVKFALGDQFTLAAELRFLKQFSDRPDGYTNWNNGEGVSHNRDWLSLLGITLSYRLITNQHPCPAYTNHVREF